MIQDIFPHIYHNEYKPVAPDSNSIILVYENGKCFFSREENSDTITLPRFKELEGQLSDLYENYIYLFSIDDDRFYLIPGLDTNLLPEYDFYEARTLRCAHPQALSFAVITGHQLYQWYKNRQYCACCGHAMKHDTNERKMYCPDCSQYEYPVLMPAVIVAITNGDKILLSKYEGRVLKQYALKSWRKSV